MSDNPYRAEITQLTTAIIDLQMELATASGAARDQLQQELNAKIAVVDKLQGMSEAWRLGRLAQAVSALQALAASELAKQARVAARLNRMMEAQGVAQTTPAPPDPGGSTAPPPPSPAPAPAEPTAPAPAVAAAPSGDAVRIEITPQDLDALTRVAQSEVAHFGQYGTAQLTGGLQAVVETILNRVAHIRFPGSIQAVVDQPFQFSAINATGSWTGLTAATAQIQTIVTDYLKGRVTGQTARTCRAMACHVSR